MENVGGGGEGGGDEETQRKGQKEEVKKKYNANDNAEEVWKIWISVRTKIKKYSVQMNDGAVIVVAAAVVKKGEMLRFEKKTK